MTLYSYHRGHCALDFLEPAYALFCSHRVSPWSVSTFREGLQYPFSVVMTEQKAFVAYAIISNVLDEAEIEDICIAPAYRCQGIATMLIESVCNELRISNITSLLLEVAQTNKPAIGLYGKTGFELVGRRKNYYQQVKHNEDGRMSQATDALLMKRLIRPIE